MSVLVYREPLRDRDLQRAGDRLFDLERRGERSRAGGERLREGERRLGDRDLLRSCSASLTVMYAVSPYAQERQCKHDKTSQKRTSTAPTSCERNLLSFKSLTARFMWS